MDYGFSGGMPPNVNGFGFPIAMGGNIAGGNQAGYIKQPEGNPNGQKPSNFREGDWMCTCGAHNYASRGHCRDCRAERQGGGGGSGRDHSRSRSRDRGSRRRGGSRSRSRDRYERRSRSRDHYRSRSPPRGRDNSCYAFQRGECERGSSCKFDHNSNSGGHRSNGGSGRDNNCYDFGRGRCSYGASCRFDHIRDGGRRGYSSRSPPARRNGGRDNSCYAFQRGECDRGDRCRFDHVRAGGPRDTTCYAFQRGECSYGDSCKFEHVIRAGAGQGREAKAPRGSIRPGDWWCGTCQVHKYAFRDDCSGCNGTKDSAAEAKITSYLEFLTSKGRAANFRPGDWVCGSCNAHCYGKKEECHACGVAGRPAEPEPELVAIFGIDYFTKSRAAGARSDMEEDEPAN